MRGRLRRLEGSARDQPKCRTSPLFFFFFQHCCRFPLQWRLSTSLVTRRTSGSGESSTLLFPAMTAVDGLTSGALSSPPPPSLHPCLSFVCFQLILLRSSAKQIPSLPPPRPLFSAPCWREMSPPPPLLFFFFSHVFCPSSFLLFICLALFPAAVFTISTIFLPKRGGPFLPFPSHLLAFWLFFLSLFCFPLPPSFTTPPSPACHYPLSPPALCPSYLPPSGASTCGDAQKVDRLALRHGALTYLRGKYYEAVLMLTGSFPGVDSVARKAL